MTDEIPMWAKERAAELANTEVGVEDFWDVHDVAVFEILRALARYIATKEEPPVDPLLIEARKAASEWAEVTFGPTSRFPDMYREGRSDDDSNMALAKIALRRGMELAK